MPLSPPILPTLPTSQSPLLSFPSILHSPAWNAQLLILFWSTQALVTSLLLYLISSWFLLPKLRGGGEGVGGVVLSTSILLSVLGIFALYSILSEISQYRDKRLGAKTYLRLQALRLIYVAGVVVSVWANTKGDAYGRVFVVMVIGRGGWIGLTPFVGSMWYAAVVASREGVGFSDIWGSS